MEQNSSIRVRFAPSPTGFLHIGSARTALFNWLFAKRHNGTFVLRIEDTDEKRNTQEAIDAIYEGLKWLSLEADEGPHRDGGHGPYFQSRRSDIYAAHIKQLQQSDSIYPCFCTRERLDALRKQKQETGDGAWGYDGHCRGLSKEEVREKIEAGTPHTWRLKVARPGETAFTDGILGPQKLSHADIEDIILIRPDGMPTYNLAVVFDDHDMEITHVIRGQDHLTNTFKQILIYGLLGWDVPDFAHISLILAPPPHKGKLSKRHGGAEVSEYRAQGYPPEAVVNWLALIGWSYGDDREKLTIDELINNFDLAHAGKSHARLNPSKLDALSADVIRSLPAEQLKEKIAPILIKKGYLDESRPDFGEKLDLIADFSRQRLSRFPGVTDLVDWAHGDVSLEKDAKKALKKAKAAPDFLVRYAEALPENLPAVDSLEEQARSFVSDQGLSFGTFARAVRAAVTGRMKTPPLFHCIKLLGHDKAVARLKQGAALARTLQDAS